MLKHLSALHFGQTPQNLQKCLDRREHLSRDPKKDAVKRMLFLQPLAFNSQWYA